VVGSIFAFLAAAIAVYQFLDGRIIAKELSLAAESRGQAEDFTEFIFENKVDGEFSRPVELDVTLDWKTSSGK
jgi:hypothetical protein